MSLFQSKEKDGTVNLRVCGYITKDPYIPDSKKVVLFSVCYGKDKYMECKAWASSKVGQLAACMEKHDEVAVDGVWEQYDGKDGKKHDQIRVDHIAVQMDAPRAEAPKQETATVSATDGGGFAELDESEDDGTLPF